ncbi:MAG: hypothetical protein HY015_09360 [Bacteroidetes bacterium]|nr:hypothetical protein [Bacteroidota bacterium]MBI3483163.1 hypothetical protein [Bacteroidota bacterium]
MISDLALLTETERDIILNALSKLKDQAKSKNPVRITELAGLGKEMWRGIDVDQYLKDLRSEWDDRKIR